MCQPPMYQENKGEIHFYPVIYMCIYLYYLYFNKVCLSCAVRLKFVKKTSMPHPVKSLGYIKCHSLKT